MYRSWNKEEDDFMTSEEGLRRGEIFRHRSGHPEERPDVKIDRHGLIWSDGKVLANLYECLHLFNRSIKWDENTGRRPSR